MTESHTGVAAAPVSPRYGEPFRPPPYPYDRLEELRHGNVAGALDRGNHQRIQIEADVAAEISLITAEHRRCHDEER